ncbi:MAG: glycosyltransferase family 2 protein [Planctomycetes bacterium]|nr:glycosyltransferase family 2 protein [Planctomycetota bacterium]
MVADPLLLAVVPAHNEAPRIAPVIAGLIEQGLPVLVIDDGSVDGTAGVAREAGAHVLRKANGGKGSAILAGCAWAIERGYAKVLLLDGDGQHDPRESAALVRASRRAGLVIGKRVRGIHRQPRHRWASNRLSSLLVTLAAGKRVDDSQSGYRVCDPRMLLALPLRGRRYDLESEMCILAARAGVRVAEVPVTVIYNDKISGMHPLFDSLRFVRALVVAFVNSRSRLRTRHRPVEAEPRALRFAESPLPIPA